MTRSSSPSHAKQNLYRRVSLFAPAFTLLLIFFTVCVGVLFWRMGRVRESEEREYRQLMLDAESSGSVNSTPYTARQERQGVQKDFFFSKGKERLQIRLKAETAQLILDQKDVQTQIIEKMQKVKCFMQEELYYLMADGREVVWQPNGQFLLKQADPKDPSSWLTLNPSELFPMQVVRFLEADEAEYYYKDGRFVGEEVKISRYILEGHQLQEIAQGHLLMKGVAGKVEFSFNGPEKELQFSAEKLKSTFFDLGSMNL